MKKAIEPFQVNGPLTYDAYLRRWDIHFAVKELTDDSDDTKRRNMFLDNQDPESFAVAEKVCPEGVLSMTYGDLTKRLREYYQGEAPKKIVYKHEFNTRSQKTEESAAVYIAELTNLATKSGYRDKDEVLVARLISGLKNDKLREKLLAEDDETLTLKFVKAKIMAHESAERTAQSLASRGNADVNQVSQQRSFKPKFGGGRVSANQSQQQQVFQSPKSGKCFACGQVGHMKKDCRFKNSKCLTCQKVGHLSKVCNNKKSKTNLVEGQGEEDDEDDQERGQYEAVTNYLLQVEASSPVISSTNKVLMCVPVNGKSLQMEVDTGATFSLIGRSTFNEYFKDKSVVQPSKVKMKAWGQEGEILALGKVPVVLQPKGRPEVKLDLLVMERNGPSLLGRNWFEPLGITVGLPVLKGLGPDMHLVQPELPSIYKMMSVPAEFEASV
ncbi:uncharacterized protein LOC132196170 [Neocloeon triangulifer]|uniref:uncharacterized protein LOC132196170 n=1 Tax=Neocloeon triangulifer TaxID=2078957 RepID=UPI00286EFA0B|nr:uncharacterized protein LOC132196170 [Neocloeon triangulifer]